MRWLRALADLLLPPVCRVCRQHGEFPLCAHCLASVRFIGPPICRKCGRPLKDAVLSPCSTCRVRQLHFHQARAAGIYEGPLREAVHALKFGRCRALATPLGQMMAEVARADPGLASARLIIPVPLHQERQRERGFNQSELLACEVGRVLGLPVFSGALRRVAATAAQSMLQFDGRRANVRAAFQPISRIPREPVLLVDDVISTGFTASECAGQLLMAGAQRVCVLTAALAIRDTVDSL